MSCRGREAELRPGAELVWHKHVQSPRGCNFQDPAWRVELLRLQEVQNHLKGYISKDSRSIVWRGQRVCISNKLPAGVQAQGLLSPHPTTPYLQCGSLLSEAPTFCYALEQVAYVTC
jgi:hypothetical protein